MNNDSAMIYVKMPRTAPLGYFAGKHETGLIEIGRLIERHGINIERALWVLMIDAYDVQFATENDLAAFKMVCPFEMMSHADGMALFEEKAAEDCERRLKEHEAHMAKLEQEAATLEELITLRAEIETLRKGPEGGR